jgi:hypothetical protein
MQACKSENRPFKNPKVGDNFNYEDLLKDTTSSVATSTEDSTSKAVATSTSTRQVMLTEFSMPQKTITISPISSSSSAPLSSLEAEKSTDEPSQPAPPASSTPASAPSSTNEREPMSAVAIPPPNNTGLVNDVTTHSHIYLTTSTLAAPKSTTTHTAEPALSTTTIAGTAAGGTVGIALTIGLILFLLRRRKRRASPASSADIWEPSRNTSPKPKLPQINNDSSFGRYSEFGAAVPMRQHSKAELYSDCIPCPPTAHDGYPNPPEMRGGSGGESTRYYHNSKRPKAHGHGSNMNSQYPELGSHTVTNMPSPSSPVSASSTMQGWQANSPSGVPTFRMSSADLRSEGVRSPVSELGTNAPLRSTRSAELHGADTISPITEAGSSSFRNSDKMVAELHTDSVLPP